MLRVCLLLPTHVLQTCSSSQACRRGGHPWSASAISLLVSCHHGQPQLIRQQPGGVAQQRGLAQGSCRCQGGPAAAASWGGDRKRARRKQTPCMVGKKVPYVERCLPSTLVLPPHRVIGSHKSRSSQVQGTPGLSGLTPATCKACCMPGHTCWAAPAVPRSPPADVPHPRHLHRCSAGPADAPPPAQCLTPAPRPLAGAVLATTQQRPRRSDPMTSW